MNYENNLHIKGWNMKVVFPSDFLVCDVED